MSDMFHVRIRTGNDAFVDDPAPELARLLRECADRLEFGRAEGNLFDVNGNFVGWFKFEKEES